MKLPVLALLLGLAPLAHAADEEVPSCQLSSQPQSCKQNNGTAYEGARRAKDAYEQGCQEATNSLRSLNQSKQQIASKCSSIGQSKSCSVAGAAKGEGSGAQGR